VDRLFKGVFEAAIFELPFLAALFLESEEGVEFLGVVSAAFFVAVPRFERPLFDLGGRVPEPAFSTERDLGSARLLPGPEANKRACAPVLPVVLEFVSAPA
jgi:hypothetical protein